MGPDRVWLQDHNEPGLRMTRSFGDTVAHSVGCIAVPEIVEYTIKKNDRFLVIASDGIWEWLSNQDVGRILYPYYLQDDAEGAAERIIREAHDAWLGQLDGIIDDITCYIVFLKQDVKKEETKDGEQKEEEEGKTDEQDEK